MELKWIFTIYGINKMNRVLIEKKWEHRSKMSSLWCEQLFLFLLKWRHDRWWVTSWAIYWDLVFKEYSILAVVEHLLVGNDSYVMIIRFLWRHSCRIMLVTLWHTKCKMMSWGFFRNKFSLVCADGRVTDKSTHALRN